MCSTGIFLGLLAILFPPLPVWVKCGICSVDSVINILLCMLGYLPGLLHAWYIIAKYPEPIYEYGVPVDSEHGRFYVFVQEGNMNYGTNNSTGASTVPATGPRQSSAPAQPPTASQNAGEGSSAHPPPPTYAQAVAGDHKVQNQE